MKTSSLAILLLVFPFFAWSSEEMVSEFLDDLAELNFVTAAISAEHGEQDQSKLFATLWFDQGQFLTPKAWETLKNGLQKYPVIYLKEEPPLTDEKYKFADYIGDFWFARASGGKTVWNIRLENEDFAILTKFLDKKNVEGETTISCWIRWVDSERIVYQTGLAQGKEREGKDFARFDEP